MALPRTSFVIPARVKTFFDYFDLSADTSEVLAAFGYGFQKQKLALPRRSGDFSWTEALARDIESVIPRVSMTSETAQREFLVAPLLFRLALLFEITIRPEYALNVSANLKGNLDYLLEGQEHLVVIEAKQGDMYKGFRQLSAELVAVDQWTSTEATHLYGAVTVGNVWQFARLDRPAKMLTQDLGLFRVPEDLEDLARVLIAILNGEGSIG